mmetsp:Transcript_1222/g.2712  ORF Transcript_1222/g.2712 Transcript_1222/m.2712 type:complete len:282 (+) Transcript_1222:282-1127(+)
MLLDYDGTLSPLVRRPELAAPDSDLSALISALTLSVASTFVVSGRDHHTLDKWLGHQKVGFFAEHGFWRRDCGSSEWVLSGSGTADWKPAVRTVFDEFCKPSPGSFVEEKATSLGWHYRDVADPEKASAQAQELHRRLRDLPEITGPDAPQVLQSSKLVEVRSRGINKGTAVDLIMKDRPNTCVIAIGDDATDEDMFRAVNTYPNSFSVHIGNKPTCARFRLNAVKDVRHFLWLLARRHETILEEESDCAFSPSVVESSELSESPTHSSSTPPTAHSNFGT